MSPAALMVLKKMQYSLGRGDIQMKSWHQLAESRSTAVWKGEDSPRSVVIPQSSYRLGTFLIKQKRVEVVDKRIGMRKDFHLRLRFEPCISWLLKQSIEFQITLAVIMLTVDTH